MKDLGEASYVLGIRIFRDRKNKMLALSQPMRHGIALSKDMSPKTSKEVNSMRKIPYASAVGSLMYAML